jgi:predicted RNA-binding protein with PIN domain
MQKFNAFYKAYCEFAYIFKWGEKNCVVVYDAAYVEHIKVELLKWIKSSLETLNINFQILQEIYGSGNLRITKHNLLEEIKHRRNAIDKSHLDLIMILDQFDYDFSTDYPFSKSFEDLHGTNWLLGGAL